VRYEVIFAAVILLGVYALITFDMVHRTVAAAIGAFFTLVRRPRAPVCAWVCGCDGGVQGVLALVKHRPTLEEVVSWVDEGASALVTVCVCVA
jgi:hypothetical protein